MRPLLYAVLVLSAVGCATAQLNPAASNVTVQPTPPTGQCQNLGMIIGEGGGTFGGAWISNDKLIEYATNDARNKAAAKGANYFQMNAPQLGGGNGTTTTATVTGVAYRCATPAPTTAAAAQAPAQAAAVK